MSPKWKREEFTEKQKAEIFVRDKALCAFTGKSLWVLDYGISYTMQIDWAEHIKPAIKWGQATLENWVCASEFFNWKKRDNSTDNLYFFQNWLPTKHFYRFWWKLPQEAIEGIKKFDMLHYSDWYFNRALSRFHRGMDSLYVKEIHNTEYKRDDKYYSKSTIVYFNKRKKEVKKSWISPLEERGLIPSNLTLDQELMYQLQNESDEERILATMHELYPYYRNWRMYLVRAAEIENEKEAEELIYIISQEKQITQIDKDIILYNLKSLFLI